MKTNFNIHVELKDGNSKSWSNVFDISVGSSFIKFEFKQFDKISSTISIELEKIKTMSFTTTR